MWAGATASAWACRGIASPSPGATSSWSSTKSSNSTMPVPSSRSANCALKRSLEWLLEREENSGGLGAIFPAMAHAIMAYKCMGLPDNHRAICKELAELAAFEIEEDDTIRMQPCVSPIWDTAIVINSLIDSGYARRQRGRAKSGGVAAVQADHAQGRLGGKMPRCGTGRVVLRDGKRVLSRCGRHHYGADGAVQSLLPQRRVSLDGSAATRPRSRCARD